MPGTNRKRTPQSPRSLGPQAFSLMDSSRVLSCDNCRHRKIKCDKQTPCSHCQAAGKHCTTNPPKPLGPRQRVLISTQYERKIDRIEERLASLEATLKSIATSLSAAPLTRSIDAPSIIQHPLVDRTRSQDDGESDPDDESRGSNDDSPPFEGESSMAVHSAQASEYLSAAVGNSPETQNIRSALSTLKSLVSKQDSSIPRRPMSFRPKGDRNASAAPVLQLPPSEVVTRLLNRGGNGAQQQHEIFELLLPYPGVEPFKQLLKETYFDPSSCSSVNAVLIHGGFYYLFMEARACADKFAGSGAFDSVMAANMAMSKDNFETALDHLELVLPATDDSVCALMIGASHAVECSKPALSWSLLVAGIGLAQSLGYHRADSPCPDEGLRHKRTYMWWSLYALDKGLSLRLGRASTIQDYDVTVGPMCYPVPKGDSSDKLWAEQMACWTAFASVQGRIYEQLYSPAALAASDEVRTAKAMSLARDMEAIKSASTNIDLDSMQSDRGRYFASSGRETDKIGQLAALTLIHRATSPNTQPTEKCIEYARLAIDGHKATYVRYKDTDPDLWQAYLLWTVIHAPFTPFTVLFCNVIATSDANDLERLGEFANSLHSSFAVTEATTRFRRVCKMFHQMAAEYVEAKARYAAPLKPKIDMEYNQKNPFGAPYPEGNNMGMGVPWTDFNMTDSVPVSEFDQYFAALGFAPQQGNAAVGQGVSNSAVPGPDGQLAYDATGLENWYQGNQYMLDLLEQDLSYLDPMQA